MTRWTHPFDDDVVVLNADVLGQCSTKRAGAPRWTEMILLGTEEAYVLYGVGCSSVEGEEDRPWLKWLAEPFLVVRALLSAPATGKSSTGTAARGMLDQAARKDEGIAEALKNWRG